MKMPITGAPDTRDNGFTFLELLVVLLILSITLAVLSSPGKKLYETMGYHSAVKDLYSGFSAARYTAISSGQITDVEIKPDTREIKTGEKVLLLPSSVDVSVIAASQLGRNGVGVIRFYPDGSSSGGSVELRRNDDGGVVINVDWMLGGLSQQAFGQ